MMSDGRGTLQPHKDTTGADMETTNIHEGTDGGDSLADAAIMDVLIHREKLEAVMMAIGDGDAIAPKDHTEQKRINLKTALEANGKEEHASMEGAEATKPTTSMPMVKLGSTTDQGAHTLEKDEPSPTVLHRYTYMRRQGQTEPGAYSCIGVSLASLQEGDHMGSDEIVPIEHASESSVDDNREQLVDELICLPTNTMANSGLVEAKVVNEESTTNFLQKAEPLELDDGAAQPEHINSIKEMTGKRRRTMCMALVACSLCILAVSVGSVAGKSKKAPKDESPSIFPSMVPSVMPSAVPTQLLDMLFAALPDSTQLHIQNGSTPQYQAWEWLSYHRNITKLPEWRKKQLFALATFFFAFEGENWNELIRERWLDDTRDECLWFSTGFGRFIDGSYVLWAEYAGGEISSCDELGQFTSLELQDLQLYGLAPTIPPEIALLSSLKTIGLYENGEFDMPLAVILPSELYQMTDLAYLWLYGNKIRGHIPTELGLLTMMRELELDENLMSGSVPSELSKMTNLEKLHLQKNMLSGSIPSYLGMMTGMTDLSLHTNSFSGSLPTELGRMTLMNFLWLGNNILSGTVPSVIGFTNLTVLGLQNNPFFGTIPPEIWQLSLLFSLDLSDLRQVTGPINLTFLSELGNLNISGSGGLSGTIPTELCSLQNSSCTFFHWYHWDERNCSLKFDCTEQLCGCSCPCPTASVGLGSRAGWG